MAKEIERKFLVNDTDYREAAVAVRHIKQGYLSANPDATVRVRIAGDKGYITVKSRNTGAVRDEWEYEIPLCDAEQMLRRCATGVIEKVRYIVPYAGYTWEVDEFAGRLVGLIVAEIELPAPDARFDVPPFIGREVTGDPRYYNSNLARINEGAS